MHQPQGRLAFLIGSTVCLMAHVGSTAAQVNTGLDATPSNIVACNGRAGFRTSEINQAMSDLNGDTDSGDQVFHVVNLSTNVITNVNIDASGPLACGGDLFAFGVSEANQGVGGTDLNLDGDKTDTVLHVYDAAGPTLTNVGLSVTAVAASGTLVAFAVSEASEGPLGTDLNLDGDMIDVVLHTWNPIGPVTTNVQRDASGDIKVVGTNVAFTVSEAAQGAAILNADGDSLDMILHLYEEGIATLTNTTRQAQPGIRFEGNVVAFLVSEEAQNLSLNPDPDKSDLVLNLYCLNPTPCVAAGLINVALAAPNPFGIDPFFNLSGDLVAISVPEKSQNAAILNGDTDRTDRVAHIYQISTGTVINTMRAVQRTPRIAGNFVAIGVPERRQNKIDLNGDGDLSDIVVQIYDVGTSTLTNTARAVGIACKNVDTPTVGDCFAMRGDMLIMQTDERRQAKTVLNGDGDARDMVVEFWRLSTGVLTNTGIATEKTAGIALGTTIAAFRGGEKKQNVDLNGDFDRRDQVMTVFDSNTLITTVLPAQAESLFLVEGNTVVFRTFEGPEATDLNTDSDLDDRILQYQGF